MAELKPVIRWIATLFNAGVAIAAWQAGEQTLAVLFTLIALAFLFLAVMT